MGRVSGREIKGEGLRAIGEWPSEVSVEQFTEVLREAIDREQDPVRRKGLQRVLEAVEQVTVSALGGVLVELARRMV